MTDNKEYLTNEKNNKGLKLLCRLLVLLSLTIGLLMKNLLIPSILICLICFVEDVFI